MNLRDKVRDTVTGYEGKVTAKAIYLNATTRYKVESIEHPDPTKDIWFDEGRLEVIEHSTQTASSASPAFPYPNA